MGTDTYSISNYEVNNLFNFYHEAYVHFKFPLSENFKKSPLFIAITSFKTHTEASRNLDTLLVKELDLTAFIEVLFNETYDSLNSFYTTNCRLEVTIDNRINNTNQLIDRFLEIIRPYLIREKIFYSVGTISFPGITLNVMVDPSYKKTKPFTAYIEPLTKKYII